MALPVINWLRLPAAPPELGHLAVSLDTKTISSTDTRMPFFAKASCVKVKAPISAPCPWSVSYTHLGKKGCVLLHNERYVVMPLIGRLLKPAAVKKLNLVFLLTMRLKRLEKEDLLTAYQFLLLMPI